MRKSVARAGAWLGAIALLLGGISACFGVAETASVEVGFIGGIIIIASSLLSAFRVVALNSSLGNHSHNAKAPAPCGARSSAPHSQGFSVAQSNTANTRIVCGEILDSQNNSESTTSDSHSVIASKAKQSIKTDSKSMDCHEAIASRNDDQTESNPHANLESKTDSEVRAERHALSAIESSFSSEPCSEQALKASSGWGIVKGEGATSQFKPLPLNKKEKTESKEVKKTLEVKSGDSEKVDSESKKLAGRDTSGFYPQYDNNSDSKSVDCHEAIASDKIKSHSLQNLESLSDSTTPPHSKISKETAQGLFCDEKTRRSRSFFSKLPQRDSANEAHLGVRRNEAEARRGDLSRKAECLTPNTPQESDDSTNAKAPPSFTSRFILGTRLSLSLLRLVAYALFILALILLLKYQLFSLAWFFGGLSVGVCALIILVARTLLTQARQTRANIAKK